jgi:hypothetical protein
MQKSQEFESKKDGEPDKPHPEPRLTNVANDPKKAQNHEKKHPAEC